METKKHQAKLVLITEDGINFLCIRQLYVSDLHSGNFIDGKIYQGKHFKLMEKTNVNDNRLPLGS